MSKGKKIFSGECVFMLGAVRKSDIPETFLPEICFAGRSNVGKSSLLNAVTGKNGLARTSSTPGSTRQINFFKIADKLIIADLPGYGFAKAGKKEVLSWNQLIKDYLKYRAQLKRVFLLIDARHGIKPNDVEIMKMLDDSAASYQMVMTKTDKVKENHLKNIVSEANSKGKKHPAMHPEILITSSEKRDGIEALREEIAGLL